MYIKLHGFGCSPVFFIVIKRFIARETNFVGKSHLTRPLDEVGVEDGVGDGLKILN